MRVFNHLIRNNVANFATYITSHFEIIDQLMTQYRITDLALHCGSMLRECARCDGIACKLLYSSHLWTFFEDYVHSRNFEIASDSFNTLRDLLTTPWDHSVAAVFIEEKYDELFTHYNKLLSSNNFVTRWRSLKLLGDILLNRMYVCLPMACMSLLSPPPPLIFVI